MPLYRINGKLIFFVHIPKTGGTSVERVLEQVGPGCLTTKSLGLSVPPQHFHAAIYNVLVPAEFYDRAFTVCRNPYTRLLSEYRHQKVRGRFSRTGLDAWTRRVLRSCQRDPFVHHNHLRSQSEFLRDGVEIFRFEEGLQRAVDTVCAWCGVPPTDLPRAKSYAKEPVAIRRQTLRAVAEFYRSDFEIFGYDPADLSFVANEQLILSGR